MRSIVLTAVAGLAVVVVAASASPARADHCRRPAYPVYRPAPRVHHHHHHRPVPRQVGFYSVGPRRGHHHHHGHHGHNRFGVNIRGKHFSLRFGR